ncbi:MAG: glycosyltransferase family 39 protein [Candidatus Zixiibacteriota bacterium]
MANLPGKSSRIGYWLATVLILAVALRLLYLFQYHESPYWDQLTVDNWYHHHWAQSLADRNVVGDTTYFRAPLYVYGLGLLYALFGTSLWVGRLFGLAIGLASVTMTYLLGRRLFGGTVALIGSLLHSVLPIAIYFESELLLDPLFTLLLQVALWRFLIWLETESPRGLFFTGLALGLASVCRPTALAVAAATIVWVVLKQPYHRQRHRSWWRLRRTIVLVSGIAVCIAPVFLRNIAVAGDPVLVASQGGINLYIGNNESADGLSAVLPEPLGHNWQIRQITHLAEQDLGRKLKPGEVSAYWRQKAVDWILAHPSSFLSLYARKLVYLMANREVPNERSLEVHFAAFPLLGRNPLVFGVILPLALCGIALRWRRQPLVRFVAAAMLVFMLAVALFFVNSRFRLPLMPLYCILAAAGLVQITVLARARPLVASVLTMGMVGAGWFTFNPPVDYPGHWTAQSLTSRGLYLYSNSDYAGALEHFRKSAAIEPEFPDVNLNLGAAYLRLGMADSAAQSFEREADLHPTRHKAYQNLASLRLLSGDTRQALLMADRSLSFAPYDLLSNLVKLRALGFDPHIGTATVVSEVGLAAVRTDDNLEVLNQGAAILVNRGDIAGALDLLYRAEVASPPPIETDDDAFGPGFRHGYKEFERTRAQTFYLIGFSYALLNRLNDAIDYTIRAIIADSLMVEAYLNLRAGYLAQGRLMEADSVLREATKRFPDHELVRAAVSTGHGTK